MLRAARLMLALLASHAFGTQAGGWIAFAAPELPQTRALFAELERRCQPELLAHDLTLRFVPISVTDEHGARSEMAQAVSASPRVILAASTGIALVAKASTDRIPIVFASFSDPVRVGLVKSLAHPGVNLTGFTYDIPVESKQLELLRELAPAARVIGILDDGHWLGERTTPEQLERYRRITGADLRIFLAHTTADLARVVTGREARMVDAWFVPIGNVAAVGRRELIDALRKVRKPAVFGRTLFVEAGGLASYQELVSTPMEIWHQILQSILKGIPPERIPVQRPKHFELAINLDEARRLGVTVPSSVLRRADRFLPEPRVP